MEIRNGNIFLFAGCALLLYNSLPRGKKTNTEHLRTLKPGVRNRFSGFVSELERRGLGPVIISSKRGYFKQSRLYAKDRRNAKPGTSTHETGEALDLTVKYKGQYLGKKTPRNIWLLSGVPDIAKKYGLKWGGNFKGYFDAGHFQAV